MRRFSLTVLLALASLPSTSLAQTGTDGHIVGSERAPATPQPAPAPHASPTITPLAHVESRGTGPIDLILIPGLSCDWRVFEAFMDRNKDAFRMWAITLPGFGGSTPPTLPNDAKLSDLPWLNNAELAVLKLIEEKKLDKPFIAGHSMGGHIAMRLAIRHADKLRGAIALDALPLFPPKVVPPDEEETPQRRAVVAQSQNEVMRLIPPENWTKQQAGGMRYLVKSSDRASQLSSMCSVVPRDTTVQYMCEMVVSDLREGLKLTKVPVLVMSALSPDLGPDRMKELRREIAEQFVGAPANVQVVYIEDSRHFIMDDRPTDLDAAIASFVRGEKLSNIPASFPTPASDNTQSK